MSFKTCRLYLTLCLCLTATSVSAAPFVSPHGYSITPAPGWRVQLPPIAGNDAVFVLDQQVVVGQRGKMPLFITQFRSFDPRMAPVGFESSSASFEAIQQGLLSRVRRRFSDLKIVSQTFSTLSGRRDLDCVFVARDKGAPVRFHEMLVLRHSTVFAFTAFCPEQTYPRYAAAFSQMFATVRWKS